MYGSLALKESTRMSIVDVKDDVTINPAMPYHGTAELIGRDGRVVDRVAASLFARRQLGVSLGAWGGQIQALELNESDWGDAETIRLRNGTEARIVLEQEAIHPTAVGLRRTGTLVGLGAPPF
jgi:hypothetical protein